MKKLSLITCMLGLITLCSAQGSWAQLITMSNLNSWSVDANCQLDLDSDVATISSKRGESWISAPDRYENFSLKGSFMLAEGGTAKIALRVPDVHSDLPQVSGYAIQFDREENQQNCLGSIIDVARATFPEEIDLDVFNDFEITAIGDYLQVKINDKKVVETHNRRSAAGKIKIGVTGGGIKIKSLALEVQPASGDLGPMTEDYIDSHPGSGFESIFDGTMKGWSNVGTSTWDVQDGNVLHGYSGKDGGFLLTDKEYKNFHLKFQFKIKKEDNSGVYIRKPLGKDVSIDYSIECNIYDHADFTHAYSTGSLATHARAWNTMIDYEDWNTGDIYALEDEVIMYVNGVKAAAALLPEFNHKGNIVLQAGIQVFKDKGPSDIYFKDLFIKSID